MKSIDVLIITIAVLSLCGTVYAERTVWYVHPDSALNTIQAGLDSCADNDIVLVGPGTYYENIVWPNTQGIHLISELGAELTIINGNDIGRVITITAGVDSTTIIGGFTVQNGDSDMGGAIQCGDQSSPTIISNIVTDNLAHYGGSICCLNSSPTIINNTISYNISGGDGGGIYCRGSNSSPTITNNTITGNIASGIPLVVGGGGICCDSASPIISNNNIADNSVAGLGGGIACFWSSNATIIDNIITGNIGTYWYYEGGGGISCFWSPNATIIGNAITGNTGGGIWCDSASPYIDSCTISNNDSSGVYCRNGSNPEIHHCDIFDNVGYGVYNADTSVTVDADSNWWGDATGPYHPTANPTGLGNAVSDYVDFDPWLNNPWGIEEEPIVKPVEQYGNLTATIFRGPLRLPKGIACRVFDITGRIVEPEKISTGIYFLEIDGVVTQKVVKVR